MLLLAKFVFLIFCANGAPVIARSCCRNTMLARPIDAHKLFIDGKPLLGPSKTWRGLLASLLITAPCAVLVGFDLLDGLIIASLAMLGDLTSSFIKRRLNISASDMALGIDQVPESLLPLLYAHFQYQLPVAYIFLGLLIFFALELLLSKLLFKAGIRKRPY